MPAVQAALRRRLGLRQANPSGPQLQGFNPPTGLRIGGVDYSAYVVQFSASVKSTISPYAGVFTCVLDGPAATMLGVKLEQELTWSRAGVVYAGIVRSIVPMDEVIAAAGLMIQIDCQDFSTLLDRDVCAYAVSPPQVSPNRTTVESDAQRIAWLMQSFGRRGVTTHRVQQNYATVPATDYTGMTLRKAIDSVLAYSGGSLYVDYSKDLHCFVDEAQYAAFSLSEAPDNATKFPYGGLEVPTDSIDLRNAIYGIPKAVAPAVADQATIASTPDPFGATYNPATLATFKPGSTGQQVAKVAIGALATGTNTAVNPAYAQATGAGHLLVAGVDSDSADVATVSAGWVKAVAYRTTTGLASSIWYKPNCGAGEVAPAFTATGGLGPMTAILGEFSGAALSSPLDQIATTFFGTSPLVLAAPGVDALFGSLIIIASHWGYGSSVTATFLETFNNNVATVHMGDDGATSQNHHASYAYGVTRSGTAAPRWYTDEASIALRGRHEDSFSDTTVTLQADLDALGAAALLAKSQPRQEGKFRCWQPGLAVGQRFTIASSLYSIPTLNPRLADAVTEQYLPSSGSPNGFGASIATFKASPGLNPLRVGSPGPIAAGTGSSVAPTYGQPTLAGDLLVAEVTAISSGIFITTASPGWVLAIADQRSAIFYKPNCAAGEADPTFTCTIGANPMSAQITEWGNMLAAGPLDATGLLNTGAGSSALNTVAATAGDSQAGELVAAVFRYDQAGTPTAVFTQNPNNGIAMFHAGDDGASAARAHTSFNYGILPVNSPGPYSGIVQAVTATYPERLGGSPEFEVEFAQPAMTLAVQLGAVVASIPAAVVLPTLGTLGYVETTTAQGGIIATVDLASLAKSVTVGIGRRIKVTAITFPSSTVANDEVNLFLVDGTGAQVQQQGAAVTAANIGSGLSLTYVATPGAGTFTYKLQMGRASGAGTITNNAAGNRTSFLLIEDIGT